MRVKLQPGQELDFVTPDELRDILREVASGFLRPPQTIHPSGGTKLNASGATQAGGFPVYVVPAGYRFRLHRMGVFPDGSTFGVPFTAAGGFVDIIRANVRVDGVSFDPTLNPTGLPAIWSAGTADGIDYNNGDSVRIGITLGPASTSINFRLQGTLEPYVEQ